MGKKGKSLLWLPLSIFEVPDHIEETETVKNYGAGGKLRGGRGQRELVMTWS